VRSEPETNTDARIPAPSDAFSPSVAAEPVMICELPHPRSRLLAVGVVVAGFLMGASHPAAGASAEDCRAFHQECTEARAAGYRDVGICNVERLECPADPEVGVPKQSHEAPGDDGRDPERAVGERSIGP